MEEEMVSKQGALVEITLKGGMRWSLAPLGADSVLEPVPPQGEMSADGALVMWKFLAARPGVATLVFTGRARPQPGSKTPHFVVTRVVDVTVVGEDGSGPA